MVETDDVVGRVAVSGSEAIINKRNNPITIKNFTVQGEDYEIFNNKQSIEAYIELYDYLYSKKIIIKKYSISMVWTLNYKFLTEDKSLLSKESLIETLKEFTNKENINFENLSNFLSQTMYMTQLRKLGIMVK